MAFRVSHVPQPVRYAFAARTSRPSQSKRNWFCACSPGSSYAEVTAATRAGSFRVWPLDCMSYELRKGNVLKSYINPATVQRDDAGLFQEQNNNGCLLFTVGTIRRH